jgi:RND family efflux transporter MFP subunit
VLVNVGDVVRKGQVLARFDSAMAQADLAQSRATVAEAEAHLAEAAANAQRARDLQPSGALSAQQVAQLLTAERTAQARLEAVKAVQQVQQLRLQQAEVLAPDGGVISARSATVGAVVPAGSELFRLIRQGRLEWRGEVAATELAQIRRGQKVQVEGGGTSVTGTVRQVAPTVDAATRNALVYVDLPDTGGRLKAGMFARGEFATGSSTALTLPQSAVLLRDGFSYVFRGLRRARGAGQGGHGPPQRRPGRDPAGPGREGPRGGQWRRLPGRRRHRSRGRGGGSRQADPAEVTGPGDPP